jgi:transposase-like protein
MKLRRYFIMQKNRKWTPEEKERIVKELLSGCSYTELQEKYNIKSRGMIANWKRMYLNDIPLNGRQGRNKFDKDLEYEILKKSFALLKKIVENHKTRTLQN